MKSGKDKRTKMFTMMPLRCLSLLQRAAISLLLLLLALSTHAQQRPQYDKLSSWLRQLVRTEVKAKPGLSLSPLPSPRSSSTPSVCAFIRIDGDGEALLSSHGARSLARWGNIHIADIPLPALSALSLEKQVKRIEAHRSHSLTNDSCAVHLRTLPVYAGTELPQPYTGRDVVVGVMDVGFDLTHPTFFNNDMSEYRIQRFWDQLSPDTMASELYVGRDYTTREEILTLAHSTDGITGTHGTHTLGTAAGSGYDSPYRGMAYESDICIVANAVSNNVGYIDSTQLYKYTYATDALGFKYMFDYAASVGKPCVISFSEGSAQDFHGDDQLYYEILDSLTGPGRIIVAAAGNDAILPTYIHKPQGSMRAGNFMFSIANNVAFTAKSRQPFTIRLTVYHQWWGNDTIRDVHYINTGDILALPDSIRNDTIAVERTPHYITVNAYPSCYNADDICYDVTITSAAETTGVYLPLSVEIIGQDADVQLFRQSGYICPDPINPALTDGEYAYCVNSPSSAPSVISVGATGYRKGAYNYKGEWGETDYATGGLRSYYSSTGPTFDGRMKPDVMAPGSNVISSYSSWYIEAYPDRRDVLEDVEHFEVNGRTYAWNRNSGTSMACPAAAGVIALWLQAFPDLTPQQVLDVIAHTSQHNDPALTYPNYEYGHGQIDAYAGLLYLLSTNSITDLPVTPTKAHITIDQQGMLTITLPNNLSGNDEHSRPSSSSSSQPLTLYVYTTQGMLSHTAVLPAHQTIHHVSLAHLQKGIYAIRLSGHPNINGSALIQR